jgi:hypothetical protein
MKKVILLTCFIVCTFTIFAQGNSTTAVRLDQSKMSIAAVSSVYLATGDENLGPKMLDDNLGTFWQTDGFTVPLPGWAIIDLGKSRELDRIQIYRREVSVWSTTKTIQCYVGNSSSYSDPTNPSNGWKSLGEVVFAYESGDGDEQVLNIAPGTDTDGRYLLLYLPDSYMESLVQVAEIYVYVPNPITVSPETQTVSGEANSWAEYSVSTTDADGWNATTTADWIDLWIDQENNTLKATAKTANLQSNERQATIKITSGDASVNVILVQSKEELPENIVRLDQSKMSIVAVSSVYLATGDENLGPKMLDDNLGTFWQTDGFTVPLPGWAIIDLGKSRELDRIQIYRREFSVWSTTKTIQCYVGNSSSYSDPTNPSNGWKSLGEVVFAYESGDGDEQVLGITPGTDTDGRYLLLYLPDSHMESLVQVAEIYVYVPSLLTVSPQTQMISGEANSWAEYSVLTTEDDGWNATTTADWIDLLIDQENNTLRATAKTANLQSNERQATIKITSGDIQTSVTLIQSKKELPENIVRLDQSKMSIAAVSSVYEALGDENLGPKMLDDNLETFWQTNGFTVPLPGWAIIDLGKSRELDRIQIYRREFSVWSTTKTIQCYVGNSSEYSDPTNPSNGWKSLGEVVFANEPGDERVLGIAPGTDTDGRYLLLYLPDSYMESLVQVAEIYVYVPNPITVSPETQTVSGEANSWAEYSVSTTDADGWDATTTADWIDLLIDQENNTLKATAKTANRQSNERQATITIVSGDCQTTVAFVQSKQENTGLTLLDKNQMSVVAVSSEDPLEVGQYIIDDNINTIWHAAYGSDFPHWAIIDLGEYDNSQDIARVEIYRRINSPYADTKTVMCYVGNNSGYNDPTTVNTTWKSIGEVEFSNTLGDNVRILDVVPGTDTKGRYLLLYMPDGFRDYGQLAEIYVFTSKMTLIPSIEIAQLNVFPNPVKDQLNITTDASIKEIALINSMGQTVLNISRKNIGNHYQIDLSSFAQGIYFLRLTIDNQIHTKKIIKTF